jgi:ubiquinone/menaquinone biosynthesis C-methylase UbiE
MSHVERVASYFRDPTPYLTSTSYNIRLRAETVREMVGDRRPGAILDVGCGDGSLSLPLLGAQGRLTLLDLSEAMLARARARIPEPLAPNVTLIRGDLMDVALPEAAFDLVLCLGVLAHVDAPRAFVGKLAPLLRPGGLTILSLSSGRHPLGYLRRLYVGARDRLRPPRYRLKWLSTREVLGWCAAEGLTPRAWYRYNFPTPGLTRLLSDETLYRNIRRVHGTVARNTRAWLGSECIVALTRGPSGPVAEP